MNREYTIQETGLASPYPYYLELNGSFLCACGSKIDAINIKNAMAAQADTDMEMATALAFELLGEMEPILRDIGCGKKADRWVMNKLAQRADWILRKANLPTPEKVGA